MGRGPGAAELTFGDEHPEHARALQSQALPGARVHDPASAVPIGIGAATPELDVEHDAVVPTAVEAALGEAAWGRRLAPRHRRTVESWFGPAPARDGR